MPAAVESEKQKSQLTSDLKSQSKTKKMLSNVMAKIKTRHSMHSADDEFRNKNISVNDDESSKESISEVFYVTRVVTPPPLPQKLITKNEKYFKEKLKKAAISSSNTPSVKKYNLPPPPPKSLVKDDILESKSNVNEEKIEYISKNSNTSNLTIGENIESENEELVNTQIYTYAQLLAGAGINSDDREQLLSNAEFERVFHMSKEVFVQLKAWKKIQLKKNKNII